MNITHGSFCCTSCSGILRGLNPPHRVKSICMATFTNEEIERLRTLGNEENSHIWLGLYSGTTPKMINKDEITAFLIRKYEKKEWYVSRSEVEEQERLLNQAKEVPNQCGLGVKNTASICSKPPDLDLFATDPFAAFGAPINRPIPHPFHSCPLSDSHAAQSVTSQPFSPPAFVAPPPPLSSEPPLQNSQFTAQVSAVFASVPENTTPGFDPFANFDAKFSELAFKSSSTVGEFGSPLPAQSLPKSATAKASFQAQTANDVLSVNSLKSEISKISPLNTAAQAEHTPATVHAGNGGDKYSALAELDQMFHRNGPNGPSGEKPAWLPSGFSTGLPPAHFIPSFGDAILPRIASSGFASIPKSTTLGAITEIGKAAGLPSSIPSGTVQHQQPFSSSYGNIARNPFVQQSFPAANPQPLPFSNELSNPVARMEWNNPFVAPFTQPRYGADPAPAMDGVMRQNNTQTWNPFA